MKVILVLKVVMLHIIYKSYLLLNGVFLLVITAYIVVVEMLIPALLVVVALRVVAVEGAMMEETLEWL